jgi:ribosomal protein S18 acetylase RimI-like enzyme
MYTLRESNEDDFEFVFQLNKTNMQKYVQMLRGWDDEAEREDMRRHFRSGSDQIIIVDGRGVGRLAVDRYPNRIELRHIEILPAYQGRGIGAAIILDILEEARQMNLPVTLMVLNVNPAKRLYERLGFRTVEEIETGKKGVKCRMEAATS